MSLYTGIEKNKRLEQIDVLTLYSIPQNPLVSPPVWRPPKGRINFCRTAGRDVRSPYYVSAIIFTSVACLTVEKKEEKQ